ncbi:MAG: hypothetical protein AWU55_146 [Halomonadaceae bacterium T82-2]|nr:MAG: hypothetical protein AWU55_146 [Halomonadaceae bacterium T82-2]
MLTEMSPPARLPFGVGVVGLFPFVLATAGVYVAPVLWQALAIKVFLFYSALTLTFLGGVHWGVAMSLDRESSPAFSMRLWVSLMPGLLGWAALMIEYRLATLVLMIGFWLLRLYERTDDSLARLPGWYQGLRSLLSPVVVACHLAVVVRLSLFG